MSPSPATKTQSWFDLNKPPVEEQPTSNQPQTTSWFDQNKPPEQTGVQEANTPLVQKVMEFLRPLASAGAGVAAGTAALPLTGPPGAALAGMGAYTATDLALKQMMGQSKPTVAEDLKDTGISGVVNEVGGQLLQGLGSVLQKFPTPARNREVAGRMAQSLTGGRSVSESLDPHFLAENLKTDLGYISQFRPYLFAKNGLGKLVNATTDAIPFIDNILNDSKEIRRALIAGSAKVPGAGAIASNNIRTDLAGYQFNRLLQAGPTAAIKYLKDPFNQEKLQQLYSTQTMGDLLQLFRASQITEYSKQARPYVALSAGAYHIAAPLISGHLTTPWHASQAALAGAMLAGPALLRVMKNHTVSRALINLAEGLPAGMSNQAISRMLVGALQGTGAVIGLEDSAGNVVKGTVEAGPNGSQFIPTEQSPERPVVAP